MNKKEYSTLIGASGSTYTFEIWAINTTTFNHVPCVYTYTKLINGYWECIYVGQTEHLATRLNQHSTGKEKSDKCIQKSGATHIHVLVLNDESARIDVETDIRNNLNYNWICNMQ